MIGCHRNDSSGASNRMWMFLGMFFTLLLLLPQTGQGGSQQEFGHEPGFVIITKLKVTIGFVNTIGCRSWGLLNKEVFYHLSAE